MPKFAIFCEAPFCLGNFPFIANEYSILISEILLVDIALKAAYCTALLNCACNVGF